MRLYIFIVTSSTHGKNLSPYFIHHELNTMNKYILTQQVKKTVVGNRLGEGIPLMSSFLSSMFLNDS